MGSKDEMLDAFDDSDDLLRSVEEGQEGPWADESAQFEDPTVARLKEQLEAKPKAAGYQERRLQELQRRALEAEHRELKQQQKQQAKEQAQATSFEEDLGAEPAPGDPAVVDRRQPGSRQPDGPVVHARRATDRVPDEPEEQEVDEQQAPERRFLVVYGPSIAASVFVFAIATTIHGLLEGWELGLAGRAVAAMVTTGVLWRKLRAGRITAILIGSAAYLLAFAPSERLGTPENVVPLVLGLLTVIAGAGLLGVQNDEFGAPR